MLTPEQISAKAFTAVRFIRPGYDQAEVDDFLDRVESDYRTALGKMNELNDVHATLEAAGKVLTLAGEESEKILAAAEEHAGRTAAEMIAAAEEEAAKIATNSSETLRAARGEAYRITSEAHGELDKARKEAQGIISAAEELAHHIKSEAHTERELKIAELDQTRKDIEQSVADLRRLERETREHLRAAMTRAVRDLEGG